MPGEVATHYLACRDIFGDKPRVGFSDDNLSRFFFFRFFKERIGVDCLDHSHRSVNVGNHL
ncbi:hypothetical protein [Mycobacteroides abscessus]|uniref:hypothetical protein n=1 Tax=Mycobacteroides abscessus TaxID=36809 RepID=UPI000945AEE6|nr:hypothetical protein [Mycobacteroides abscessus]